MAKTIVSAPGKTALPRKQYVPPAKRPWDLPQPADASAGSFAFSGSQVNTDLALTADCELNLDFVLDPAENEIASDLLTSPMVAQLVAQYENDLGLYALSDVPGQNIPYALLQLIQRAYTAGLYSPVRLAPKSTADRAAARAGREEFEQTLKGGRRG